MSGLSNHKSYPPRTSPPVVFRMIPSIGALTALSAALLAVAWWAVPGLLGNVSSGRQATVAAAVVAWGSSILGLVPIAVTYKRGLMPTVYGYFVGASLRVIICVVASVVAIQSVQLSTSHWAITLLGMYLLLLVLEVALVGRCVWHMGGASSHTGGTLIGQRTEAMV